MSLVWLCLLALVTSLTASLLVQAGLMKLTQGMLTALVPSLGPEPAIMLTALVECALVVGFVTALAAWLETLTPSTRGHWLLRATGIAGLLVVLVSLLHLESLDVYARAQLGVTLVWSALALWLSRGAEAFPMRWPRPWVVPTGALEELLAMGRHMLLFGLLFGLLGYVLALSNFLKVTSGLSPTSAPTLYEEGFKLGILLALLVTPATRDLRTPLVVGYLVDWVGGMLLPGWSVTLLQIASIMAATMVTQHRFETAWRLSAGMCGGRLLGRALGFLLVGAEGVILLEPLMEVTVGVLAADSEGTAATLPHP